MMWKRGFVLLQIAAIAALVLMLFGVAHPPIGAVLILALGYALGYLVTFIAGEG